MTISEIFLFWQTAFTGVAAFFAGVAGLLAYKIGKRQNEINKRMLDVSNFVEIFLMPQMQNIVDNGKIIEIKYAILIKNISSYPVYLNNYVLNEEKTNVDGNAIPNNPDGWYSVLIPDNVQKTGKFLMIVEFEDYFSNKYRTEATGIFNGVNWNMNSKKKIKI